MAQGGLKKKVSAPANDSKAKKEKRADKSQGIVKTPKMRKYKSDAEKIKKMLNKNMSNKIEEDMKVKMKMEGKPLLVLKDTTGKKPVMLTTTGNTKYKNKKTLTKR
ncbi:adenosylhomocysteinase [Acrasis kona]|uniref:Adenosylhomocysteinase n=1 Tax=Acrasis kona TaxID=1008807 RepID=A0AAW2Z0T8_9EUKA